MPLYRDINPHTDIINQLLHSSIDTYTSTKHYSFIEQLYGIYHAIEWSEKFIIIVLGFHIFLFIVTLLYRHNIVIQSTLLFLTFLIVLGSESINQYASLYSHHIATHPSYFDEQGLFITIILNIPLCIIACISLINLLIQTSHLLIKVKRYQQQAERRQHEYEYEHENGGKQNGTQEEKMNDRILRQRRAVVNQMTPLD